MNQAQVYMCPLAPEAPCLLSPHPIPLVVIEYQLWFPVPYIKLPLAIYFAYGNMYVSMLLSQIIPPSPSPTVSKSLFFMSVSPLLPCM